MLPVMHAVAIIITGLYELPKKTQLRDAFARTPHARGRGGAKRWDVHRIARMHDYIMRPITSAIALMTHLPL